MYEKYRCIIGLFYQSSCTQMWPGDTCHSTHSADEVSLAEVPEGKRSIRRSRSIEGGG